MNRGSTRQRFANDRRESFPPRCEPQQIGGVVRRGFRVNLFNPSDEADAAWGCRPCQRREVRLVRTTAGDQQIHILVRTRGLRERLDDGGDTLDTIQAADKRKVPPRRIEIEASARVNAVHRPIRVDVDGRQDDFEAAGPRAIPLHEHLELVAAGHEDPVRTANRPAFGEPTDVLIRRAPRVIRDQRDARQAREQQQHVEAAAGVILHENQIGTVTPERAHERQRQLARIGGGEGERAVGRARVPPTPGLRMQVVGAPQPPMQPRCRQEPHATPDHLMSSFGLFGLQRKRRTR
jgi:hypothetical protein